LTQSALPFPDPETRDGIKRAFDNANPLWVKEVTGCVRNVAMRYRIFTIDEVQEELELNQWHFDTHNTGAMPGLMRQVMIETHWFDYCREEPTHIRTTRPGKHGNWRRRYVSLIYQERKCH